MISDDSLNIDSSAIVNLSTSTKVITRNGVNYYNVSNWIKTADAKETQVLERRRSEETPVLERALASEEKVQLCKEESGLCEAIIDKSRVPNELKETMIGGLSESEETCTELVETHRCY